MHGVNLGNVWTESTDGLRSYGERAVPIFMQTMVMHERNLEKINGGSGRSQARDFRECEILKFMRDRIPDRTVGRSALY